jgi:hypothetical protein
VSFGDAPLASFAQDGSDLGHWSYLTTKGQSARRDLWGKGRWWKVRSG